MQNAPKVLQAIVNITEALSKIGIAKGRKNSQQGYSFRGIDDVYQALAPLLAQHKLCMLPVVLERSVNERTTKNGTALFYVSLMVAFDLISAEDGSERRIITAGEAMDSGDKATNKAQSAAYKYAAIMAFCIPTEGDSDTETQTHEVAAKSTIEEDAKYIASAVDDAKTFDELMDIVHTHSEFIDQLKKLQPKWHAALLAKINSKRAAFIQGKAN